jgi:hypothetical protein
MSVRDRMHGEYPQLKLRFTALNLLGQRESRDRLFFNPDRRAGPFTAERSSRDPGIWYQLGISGSL